MSNATMSDDERRLFIALVLMSCQFLDGSPEEANLDSLAMTAGEHAFKILFERGLVVSTGKGRMMGDWSEAGIDFFRQHLGWEPKVTHDPPRWVPVLPEQT